MTGKSKMNRSKSQSARSILVTLAPREEAAELVEAAFVLPLVLMLLLGFFWLGRAYETYESITRAAREGAKALVLTSCATCGNTMYSASYVQTNFVNASLTSASLDPAQVQNYQSDFVWMDPSATPQQICGVQISFTYPLQVQIPFTTLNGATLNISTTVQMRMENQPSTCAAGSAVP